MEESGHRKAYTCMLHLLCQRRFVIRLNSFARPLPEFMRQATAATLCIQKIEIREIK